MLDPKVKEECPLSEFHRPGQKPEINIGDLCEVFIESVLITLMVKQFYLEKKQ